MKTAIVTGGSDGLGLEISKELLKRKWDVICLSRSKPTIKVEWIECDLENKKSIEKVVEKLKTEFPKFDVLINNAGKIYFHDIDSINYDEADSLLKLNVLAPVYLTSLLMDLIINNQADIVNISSTVGFKAYERQAVYGISKWAIRGFNEYLRLELKDTKTRVIGFYPGGFKSKFVQKATGKVADLSGYMEPNYLARALVETLELPKDVEVSEIVINRKKK